jgi:hypothetical protein
VRPFRPAARRKASSVGIGSAHSIACGRAQASGESGANRAITRPNDTAVLASPVPSPSRARTSPARPCRSGFRRIRLPPNESRMLSE